MSRGHVDYQIEKDPLYDALKARIDAYENDPEGALEELEELRELIHSLSPNKAMPIDRIRWVPKDMVEANHYNPNSVAKVEMNLLYVSISHDGYCVEQSTPILMADLTWKPAGSLVAGEKIIAFDEFGTLVGNRSQRRYRTGYVTSNALEDSELVEVVTSRGSVRVTPDHPFLAYRNYGKGHHPAEWIEAQNLKPGDDVQYVVDTWETDLSWESGWLSGFLDGEGTISKNQVKSRNNQTYRLAGYQRPGATADRMIQEMSRRAHTKVYVVDRTGHDKWNSMVMARIDRMTEIMKLLGTVRPERLMEVAGDFWEGVALASGSKDASRATVESVTKVDNGVIARLSTDTRTYVGNGFAMHNTQPIVTVWDDKGIEATFPCGHKILFQEGSDEWKAIRNHRKESPATPLASLTAKGLSLSLKSSESLDIEADTGSKSPKQNQTTDANSVNGSESNGESARSTSSTQPTDLSTSGTSQGSMTSSSSFQLVCRTCASSDKERKRSWTSSVIEGTGSTEGSGVMVSWITSGEKQDGEPLNSQEDSTDPKMQSVLSDGNSACLLLQEMGRYVIIDGFHRYFTLMNNDDLSEQTHGRLPIVVLDKSMNDRMASTVRHNRARGKHSVQGMSSMVYDMLKNGWTDDAICNELGMSADELVRLKHVTGFSKLFKDAEFSREWKTKSQLRASRNYRDVKAYLASRGEEFNAFNPEHQEMVKRGLTEEEQAELAAVEVEV